MTKIFTDENGNKFEYVQQSMAEDIIIRPIKEEPKWIVTDPMISSLRGRSITIHFDVAESQANLIKQAIETTMKILMTDEEVVWGTGRFSGSPAVDKWSLKIELARQALQKDKL